MNLIPSRCIMMALGIAALSHGLMFAFARPLYRTSSAVAVPVPPRTRYTIETEAMDDATASGRLLNSPVLFSLPSEVGFSSGLAANDVQTRKTFIQPQLRSEQFLQIASPSRGKEQALQADELMISAAARRPIIPEQGTGVVRTFPTSRRVMLEPALRARLMGGIVLPSELNREVEQPWQVTASLSISDQGAVDHVFIEKPLVPSRLNEQVLRLLYGLRFRPGRTATGTIEIYSPEARNEGDRP